MGQQAPKAAGHRVQDAPPRVDHLRERRAARDVEVAHVASAHVECRLVRLGVQGRVDRLEQRVSDALVDEGAHARQHDRHHQRERERQPQPDGQPVHPLARSL